MTKIRLDENEGFEILRINRLQFTLTTITNYKYLFDKLPGHVHVKYR